MQKAVLLRDRLQNQAKCFFKRNLSASELLMCVSLLLGHNVLEDHLPPCVYNSNVRWALFSSKKSSTLNFLQSKLEIGIPHLPEGQQGRFEFFSVAQCLSSWQGSCLEHQSQFCVCVTLGALGAMLYLAGSMLQFLFTSWLCEPPWPLWQ